MSQHRPTPSYPGLLEFLTKRHNLTPTLVDEVVRFEFGSWMSIGSPNVEEYLSQNGFHRYTRAELIDMMKPPRKAPRATQPSTQQASDYSHLRGGIKGKVKEAMAKKSIRIYTITQLQTIVKQLKSFQNTYNLPRTEDIEIRFHAFPKEPGQKAYPLEVTMFAGEHFTRSFIDPHGDLQWEQRYDCALTYDTYGPMTEGDDLEDHDDSDDA